MDNLGSDKKKIIHFLIISYFFFVFFFDEPWIYRDLNVRIKFFSLSVFLYFLIPFLLSKLTDLCLRKRQKWLEKYPEEEWLKRTRLNNLPLKHLILLGYLLSVIFLVFMAFLFMPFFIRGGIGQWGWPAVCLIFSYWGFRFNWLGLLINTFFWGTILSLLFV